MELRGKNPALAERSRNELQSCTSAILCGPAGQLISRISRKRLGTPEFRQDDEDLAAKLLMRARNLDPGNPQWSQQFRVSKMPVEPFPRSSDGGVIGGILGALPSAAMPTGPSLPDVQKIRVAGNVQAANILKQPAPVYPPLAKQARIQGTVRFNALIGKNGSVESLELVSGHPLFVESAQSAIRQWVYQPTFLNGVPVLVVTTVDVNFTLNGETSNSPPSQ